MNIKLDKEEKEILESYENDEWISVSRALRKLVVIRQQPRPHLKK